jgi:hypothetical protein
MVPMAKRKIGVVALMVGTCALTVLIEEFRFSDERRALVEEHEVEVDVTNKFQKSETNTLNDLIYCVANADSLQTAKTCANNAFNGLPQNDRR